MRALKYPKLKLLADCEKPIVVAPPELGPIEVEAPTNRAGPEKRNEPNAKVPPEGTKNHNRELPLRLRVLGPEGEEFLDCSRTQTTLVELAEHDIGLHVAIEVDELGHDLLRPLSLDWEVFGRDIRVHPVVPSGFDHLPEGEIVVDGDGVGRVGGSCSTCHDNTPFSTSSGIWDLPFHTAPCGNQRHRRSLQV